VFARRRGEYEIRPYRQAGDIEALVAHKPKRNFMKLLGREKW
jgi:hypothetical protein